MTMTVVQIRALRRFRTLPKMLGAKEIDKIQSLSSYIICLVVVTPSGKSMLLYVLIPLFCCTD